MIRKELKQLRSLHQKKFRCQYGQFLIEGLRLVTEAVEAGGLIDQVYTTELFEADPNHRALLKKLNQKKIRRETINQPDMNRISGTASPPGILSVCPIPKTEIGDVPVKGNWLYLDQIRDPGNLGTLLRTAAWFGISAVAISPHSADPFNPKVVRSGMGAHFHIKVLENVTFDQIVSNNREIFIADSQGTSETWVGKNNKPWILVLGSEANGISKEILQYQHQTLAIPKLGRGESLNVAVAGGILISKLVLETS